MVSMNSTQPGILQPVPAHGRHLFFSLARPAALREALGRVADAVDGRAVVLGLGPDAVRACGADLPGLRDMPELSGPGAPVPRTPAALWCWLRGDSRGELVHRARRLEKAVAPALELARVLETFRHDQGPNGHGRDLTGYEDGTENPEGEAAEAAALVQGQGAGQDGASFVAVQQWRHDFDAFDALGVPGQDLAIGRRRADNEEIEEAPESAHVKRTAQEDFAPEAFVLRRSMPWAGEREAGLMFVAFGRSFDAFEAQMRRMAGHDDGIVDALFRFSRPVSGAYFWCPPLHAGRPDLRSLGL